MQKLLDGLPQGLKRTFAKADLRQGFPNGQIGDNKTLKYGIV
jgi:hypothetical protein